MSGVVDAKAFPRIKASVGQARPLRWNEVTRSTHACALMPIGGDRIP